MGIPSRMQDYRLVVSKLKQADYATLVSDANLQGGKRLSPNAPLFGHRALSFENNLDVTMKGHDYATQQWEVERNSSDQLAHKGDTWLLGWLAGFGLGKVSSVQPDAGGAPTAWRHTFRPLDPGVDGKDLPVTTVYRELTGAANLKGRMHSVAVASFGISFPASRAIQCEASLLASGQETTGALATPPALLSLVPLFSNDMVFSRGAQGAPTAVTSRVVRGSMRFGFTWNLDEENARHAGSGLYRARAWVGTPAPTLEWQELVDDSDAAVHDAYLAQTIEEVKLNILGPTIAAAQKHELEIRFLAARPKITGRAQSGDKTIYSFRVGPEDAFKESTNDVFTVIVENTESSYLT